MPDAAGNSYGPYDTSVNPDAESFTEQAWDSLMGWLSGVRSGGVLTFSGLTAQLAPIHVVSHGFWLRRTAQWTDATPPTAAGSQPRRDLLVARRQLTAGTTPGSTFLTVLRGASAASPVDPAHDPDNDERLWSWQVPGNGGTVVTAIRDLRRATSEPALPHAMLQGTGTQGVATGGTAKIVNLNVLQWAVDLTHTAATGRLTATKGGIYLCSGSVYFASSGSGRRNAHLYKNGVRIGPAGNGFDVDAAGDVWVATPAIPVQLLPTDYLQLAAYQDSGGTLNVDRAQSFLQAHMIRPLPN